MADKTGNQQLKSLRKTLSANIKKYRENLNLTQEKLAEAARISANMNLNRAHRRCAKVPPLINDIEGCRTWISDKTLISLAAALKVETYRLFLPQSLTETDIEKTALLDLSQGLEKSKRISIPSSPML